MTDKQDNTHRVRATRRNGRLRAINLDIPRKSSMQIDFDNSNGNVVLTIGTKTYIVVPEPPPESVLYQVDEKETHQAVLLKEGAATRTDDLTANVILDGNQTFKIGHSTLESQDDKVCYKGKWYSPGDEITINGRTAKIQESKNLTASSTQSGASKA